MTLPYKIAAVIALCAALWWHGWDAGNVYCKTKQMKETIKVVEKVRYVRQKTDAMPSSVVHERLREWQR